MQQNHTLHAGVLTRPAGATFTGSDSSPIQLPIAETAQATQPGLFDGVDLSAFDAERPEVIARYSPADRMLLALSLSEVSWRDRCVAAVLAYHGWISWPGRPRIARKLRMLTADVSRPTTALEKAGVIKKVPRYKKGRQSSSEYAFAGGVLLLADAEVSVGAESEPTHRPHSSDFQLPIAEIAQATQPRLFDGVDLSAFDAERPEVIARYLPGDRMLLALSLTEVSWRERCVAAVLAYHGWISFRGRDDIARTLRMAKVETVSNATTALEKAGVIKKVPRYNKDGKSSSQYAFAGEFLILADAETSDGTGFATPPQGGDGAGFATPPQGGDGAGFATQMVPVSPPLPRGGWCRFRHPEPGFLFLLNRVPGTRGPPREEKKIQRKKKEGFPRPPPPRPPPPRQSQLRLRR